MEFAVVGVVVGVVTVVEGVNPKVVEVECVDIEMIGINAVVLLVVVAALAVVEVVDVVSGILGVVDVDVVVAATGVVVVESNDKIFSRLNPPLQNQATHG
jgi:hypothetical protein